MANDPYAFVIAVCLDRGMKAEVVWTIPFYLKSELGHLDPHKIYEMSVEQLLEFFKRLRRKPRYLGSAPKTLKDITRIVVEDCHGDAVLIWKDKTAEHVNRTFQSVYGVGPGIASMGVLLIEQAFGIRFADLDRPRMDIKADVHTMRVLYRLGLSDSETEDAALAAARRLYPEFPGGVDGPLWEIGRRWCDASRPNCAGCPVETVCAKRMH